MDGLAVTMDVCHVPYFVLASYRFRDYEENLLFIVDIHRQTTVITTPILIFPDFLKASG